MRGFRGLGFRAQVLKALGELLALFDVREALQGDLKFRALMRPRVEAA